MIWLWSGLAVLICLLAMALLAPLRLKLQYPEPSLELRWFGLAFDLYYLAGDLRMKLVFWGLSYHFAEPEENSKQKKEKEKKAKAEKKKLKKEAKRQAKSEAKSAKLGKNLQTPKKWRIQNLSRQLIEEVRSDPAFDSIKRKSLHFLRRFWRSAKIEEIRARFDTGDFYTTAMFFAVLSWYPRPNRLKIEPNFVEEQFFLLLLKVSLWRILKALVLLLLFFPYLKTHRLYAHVRHQMRS